ncbi:malonic semialdehyde reductase [Diaphorobacter caeni]|uniref:malonic semialdehyde reductase n=1 Tax=Diaphorobacter caeni TaxID=2784387 RepID=UPI0018903F6F|nr:malonic semialdehyde reductase [Diaphorobacter caeni]MBF5006760.1 malonic semialdehyde reductase [Diaphorobacter caeni]
MPDNSAVETLFLHARSHNGFLNTPVPQEQLRRLYDLMKMGPTSANCCPLRVVFVTSPEARARLLPALSPGNVAKVQSAPVTALLARDTRFHERAERLFPHNPQFYRAFADDAAHADATARRNATLQAGYFLMAARAVGLDCGPMSGFDEALVNSTFFPDGQWRIDFLCNLGQGDPAKLFGKLPRLDFEEACQVL